MSGGLPGFLTTRWDEDERAARSEYAYDRPHAPRCGVTADVLPECDCDMQARVLAEVDAKRRVLALHVPKPEWSNPKMPVCNECGGSDWRSSGGDDPVMENHPWVMPWPCPTLRAMGLPYVSHPDYQEGWKL